MRQLKDFVRNIVAFGSLFALLTFDASSQTPAQVNDPSNPVPDYVKRAAEARANNTPSFQEMMQRARLGAVWPGSQRASGMSSKDRKRLKALMTPDRADLEKYRDFLKQDDTAIFRLYPDFDCEKKGVVSVAGNCAHQVYKGSFYSFRDSNYFSDLKYNNGKLWGSGFFSHEIFVDLGDVPLESLNVNSAGISFLNSYSPANDYPAANEQFRRIVSGIKDGGLDFSRSVAPMPDHTYAVRIVAFNNKDSIQNRLFRSRGERQLWQFRSVQMDKRTDSIFAFRIIRMEDDGNITVLSRRLSQKKAPFIAFGEREPMKNFK